MAENEKNSTVNKFTGFQQVINNYKNTIHRNICKVHKIIKQTMITFVIVYICKIRKNYHNNIIYLLTEYQPFKLVYLKLDM